MYGVKFAPKTKPFTIEEDGETETYYVSQRAVIEAIRDQDRNKGKPQPTGENANREMIKKYLVYEDGSPVTEDDIGNILQMRPSAFAKFSRELTKIVVGDSGEVAKNESPTVPSSVS
jgi:hypothetical protein